MIEKDYIKCNIDKFEEDFVKFVKSKDTQDQIQNIFIFFPVVSDSYMLDLCLSMYLQTLEINKLSKTELETLKSIINDIRSKEMIYIPTVEYNTPEPTDEFIKEKCVERFKNGYLKTISYDFSNIKNIPEKGFNENISTETGLNILHASDDQLKPFSDRLKQLAGI